MHVHAIFMRNTTMPIPAQPELLNQLALFPECLQLATDFNHPVYDAVYGCWRAVMLLDC